ncbi:MAG: glycoside hydrolase family 92 protein, partial [bacterium]|nr:glycoside hydrolase family 92 protein [bacterium]
MKSLPTAILVAVATLSPALGADLTDYIDPRIGNVSMLLVPTFPTFSLPNQMLRMVPAKNNYIEDQVSGFPLQVGGHRMAGIVPMKVVLGPLTAESWKRKMTIDHDLEVVRPWHYSTYLIDDDIRVSFTPAKRAAIYQVDFPVTTADRNLLFSGSANLKISSPGANAFALEDQFSFDNKGLKTITLTQT